MSRAARVVPIVVAALWLPTVPSIARASSDPSAPAPATAPTGGITALAPADCPATLAELDEAGKLVPETVFPGVRLTGLNAEGCHGVRLVGNHETATRYDPAQRLGFAPEDRRARAEAADPAGGRRSFCHRDSALRNPDRRYELGAWNAGEQLGVDAALSRCGLRPAQRRFGAACWVEGAKRNLEPWRSGIGDRRG